MNNAVMQPETSASLELSPPKMEPQAPAISSVAPSASPADEAQRLAVELKRDLGSIRESVLCVSGTEGDVAKILDLLKVRVGSLTHPRLNGAVHRGALLSVAGSSATSSSPWSPCAGRGGSMRCRDAHPRVLSARGGARTGLPLSEKVVVKVVLKKGSVSQGKVTLEVLFRRNPANDSSRIELRIAVIGARFYQCHRRCRRPRALTMPPACAQATWTPARAR